MAIFHILTKLNYLSTLSVGTSVPGWAGWATATYGRVGKLKTRVGKRKNFFRRFAPNFIKQMFAHPGLKRCRRPCSSSESMDSGRSVFWDWDSTGEDIPQEEDDDDDAEEQDDVVRG